MSESIRRNFEPGRWLLVSGVMLSVVLMLQLYAINETVDISSIDSLLGDNYVGMLLIASYVLTTVAMVTVVVEYFSVKKKVDGLLALTQVLNVIEDLQYPGRPGEVDPEEVQMVRPAAYGLDEEEELYESESLQEIRAMDPMERAYGLLDEEDGAAEEPGDVVNLEDEGNKTIEVKTMEDDADDLEPEEEEPEPSPEAGLAEEKASQMGVEEDEVEGMLEQSEVISTLSELERVVEELKTNKPKIKAA
jgi:hypothetical protein